MTRGMGEFTEANADALERALAARRLELEGLTEPEDRDRLAGALSLIEEYAALLRAPATEAARANPVSYWFKLVFPDGRWNVDEKRLPEPPSAGDVVDFDRHGTWRIERSERVGVKPAGKRSRELFVCAPAA